MKILIKEIVIEGTTPEIKGLFSSQELHTELQKFDTLIRKESEESKEVPAPEVINFNDDEPPFELSKKAEEPEPTPAPTPEAPKEKKLTNEDIREAMEKVRNKFEYGTPAAGEDKGPNEEMDAKLHKQLTGLFKDAAKRLGSDKPSTLPEDKREDFIKAINDIQMNEDGTITPF